MSVLGLWAVRQGAAEPKNEEPVRVFADGRAVLHAGDCFATLRTLGDNSLDAIVTDPPYALVSIGKRFGADGAAPAIAGATGVYARASAGFMGKKWDTGETAFSVLFWVECMRVLKPGGYVAAFSGTRTYHRLACAIEDAGFDIRDQLAWVYGSGFPKSLDISKAIDKDAGHWRGRAGAVDEKTVGQVAKGTEYERTEKGDPITAAAAAWSGWGTALKPAWEPIVLARKPLIGTNVENVLAWGTGALNIDGCRVGDEIRTNASASSNEIYGQFKGAESEGRVAVGRFPANILHDGSDEVLAVFPYTKSNPGTLRTDVAVTNVAIAPVRPKGTVLSTGDSGSAARFFYCAKASSKDRAGSKHPTVKPISLMRWLCRLITPPGGTVLDPFAGSGTTGVAALEEGFNVILCERETEYLEDITRRLKDA